MSEQTAKKIIGIGEDEFLFYFDSVSESKIFVAHDGIKIHYRQLISRANKKLLVILPGRTEPARKYAELTYDLKDEGYDIVVIDHRGQGFSDRLLEDVEIGHVENFDHYVLDLEEALNCIGKIKKYKKKKMLAHSMGTIVGLIHAQDYPNFWDGIILGSPMLQINLSPIPQWCVENLLKLYKGFGMANGYVPSGDPGSASDSFETNIVTHSKERYERSRSIEKRNPGLYVSSPSMNWVLEALKGSQKALDNKDKLKMPILMFQAGEDGFVESEAQDKFDQSLDNCEKIRFENAFHEIFQEEDSIREVVLEKVKHFLSD